MMWIFIACLLWCSVYWQQNIKEMPLTGSSVCNSSFTHKPAVRTGISLASSISFIADSGMQKKCQKLPMVDQSIDYDLDVGVKCLTAETKPLSCSLVRLNSQPQWLTFGQSFLHQSMPRCLWRLAHCSREMASNVAHHSTCFLGFVCAIGSIFGATVMQLDVENRPSAEMEKIIDLFVQLCVHKKTC